MKINFIALFDARFDENIDKNESFLHSKTQISKCFCLRVKVFLNHKSAE